MRRDPTDTPQSSDTDPTDQGGDVGTALVLALVLILISAMIVIPALEYTMTVTRAGRSVDQKVSRAEAVKGGLRTVLANGKGLYQACKDAGLTQPVTLASPGLNVGVTTSCTKTADKLAEDENNLWFAGASTWAGSVLPAGLSGTMYPGSGAANPRLWRNDVSAASDGNKVWAPELPVIPTDLRSNAGYGMPSAYGACRVYFPGKYTDPLVLTANSNYYFVSGVYYFENTVRISGDAKVVFGLGATEGCTDDLDAVSYADYSAPFNHNQSGAGATFVFGATVRLVVDDVTTSTTHTGHSVTLNKRLVSPTETGVLNSEGVSIMSVNGVLTGTTIGNLDQPQIFVPAPIDPSSNPSSSPPPPASGTIFKPSTLVPTVAPAVPANPIVDINITGADPVTVDIESYIATPQGTVNINTAPTAVAGKKVSMVGGVLAANIVVSPDRPATFAVGLVNQVVQKTFKIVSSTSSGTPAISAVAIVKVNDTGDYAIGSYVVQTG